jgi:hypothetical protein
MQGHSIKVQAMLLRCFNLLLLASVPTAKETDPNTTSLGLPYTTNSVSLLPKVNTFGKSDTLFSLTGGQHAMQSYANTWWTPKLPGNMETNHKQIQHHK